MGNYINRQFCDSYEIDSKIISISRFPLAIMVVAIHACPKVIGFDGIDSFSNFPIGHIVVYIIYGISNVLSHVAVPLFFLISGYLFFSKLDTWNFGIWWGKIRKRINTLAIPYLIWNTFYLVKIAKIPQIADYWCSKQWNFGANDVWGIPILSTSPALVPMWFIRDLMVSFLLSPLFFFLLKKKKRRFSYPEVGLLLLLFFNITQTSIPVPGFSFETFFYFGIGTYLSVNGMGISNDLYKKRKTVLLISLFLLLLSIYYNGHNTQTGKIIYPLWVLFGVSSSIIILKKLIIIENEKNFKSSFFKFTYSLSETTFFIFAMHFLLISYTSAIPRYMLRKLTGVHEIDNITFIDTYPVLYLFYYIFSIICTILVCLLLYYILKCITPQIIKTICGR